MIPKDWVKGYAKKRSDWSQTPECDYSTNRLIHDFYHEKSEWYRTYKFKKFYKTQAGNFPKEIFDRVLSGDTIRIGFDYYSLTPISKPIVPIMVLKKGFNNNQVYVYKMFKQGNRIAFKEEK
ncbi:MAG: hypothetical protein R6V04_10385 [bacterium]